MNNLSNEERKTLVGLARIEVRRWSSLPDKQYMVDLMNIALTGLEQQGGWISCSERMPPSKTGVLVGSWYGREWATKWATLIHGHPDASNEGWIIPGASWVPTHWHELPPQPQPSITPQIDNDGWIEWCGGNEAPKTRRFLEVQYKRRGTGCGFAKDFDWSQTGTARDIIAYRVIENDGREG